MIDCINDIKNNLVKYNLKLWVMVSKDASDKIFHNMMDKKISVFAMLFISTNKTYLLIHELDKDNVDIDKLKRNNIFVLIYNNSQDLTNKVEDIISYLGFITPISLSYSTMGDQDTDILGHGEFIKLTKVLRKPYTKYKKHIRFSSAEKVIYSILGSKTDKQIERIKYVANITNEIIETMFKTITTGMSEIDIAKHIVKLTEKITVKYLGEILIFSLAWDNCPIVLTGNNLTKGGHSVPSDKILEKGETIYVDFGICAKYKDGEMIYSDLQRMGYSLKHNEVKPPKNVIDVFETLVHSIENSLDYMKSDVKAYKIDELVRDKLVKKGYPNYNHSTGHPVGLKVHDTGAVITNRLNKRSKLNLVENGVYTLEPRIAINNGGSIEEMIIVTKFGGIPVCRMQKDIYLV